LGSPQAESGAPASAPPAEKPAGPRLEIGEKIFPLDKDQVTIGRKSQADGIFPDVDLTDDDPGAFISRRHGRIIKQGGEFIFEDMGSSNGSHVNDTRVEDGVQHPLKGGDLLRLGKTELVFKV
jgi:pSer/pThr/pTyr-binding forkhead associated (FHA) protein